MSTFTLIHVAISLIGIATGLVVVYGFVAGEKLPAWNAVFLVFTILTSVTGFFFPFHGITPGIVVGVISLVVLVLIVQSFMKIAALHALAPKGTEPITNVVKVAALVLFVVLAWAAIRRGRFVLG